MRKRIDTHVHITGEDCLRKGQMIYFTVEDLIAMMDHYGVEKAVIQQSLKNEENDIVMQAVQKYPDRLAGSMIIVPEAGWKEKLHRYKNVLHSIKFEMEAQTAPDAYPHAKLNDTDLMEIYDEAEKEGLTIVIDPARIDLASYDPEGMKEAITSHPHAKFVLCHLGFPMPIDTEEQINQWKQMIENAKYENCWVDISAMPDLFHYEKNGYPTMLKLLKEVKETYGVEKLLWGSDIPGLLKSASYEQMIAMFEQSGVFTQEELDQVFYENALKVYRWN